MNRNWLLLFSILVFVQVCRSQSSISDFSIRAGLVAQNYPGLSAFGGFHFAICKTTSEKEIYYLNYSRFITTTPIHDSMNLIAYDYSYEPPVVRISYQESLTLSNIRFGYKRFLFTETEDQFGFYIDLSFGFEVVKDRLQLGNYNKNIYDENTAEPLPGTKYFIGVPVQAGLGIQVKYGSGYLFTEPEIVVPVGHGQYSTITGSDDIYLPINYGLHIGYRLLFN